MNKRQLSAGHSGCWDAPPPPPHTQSPSDQCRVPPRLLYSFSPWRIGCAETVAPTTNPAPTVQEAASTVHDLQDTETTQEAMTGEGRRGSSLATAYIYPEALVKVKSARRGREMPCFHLLVESKQRKSTHSNKPLDNLTTERW